MNTTATNNPRVNIFNPASVHNQPMKEYSGAEICGLVASKNFADRDFGNHLARVYGKHSGRYVPGGVSQELVDLYQLWNDNAANKWEESPYSGIHRMPETYDEAVHASEIRKFSVYQLIDSIKAREDNPEIWADIIARQPELWK